GSQRPEGSDGLEGLVQNLHAVDTRDDHGCRKAQGIMQALGRRYHFAFQEDSAAHTLHPQDSNLFLDQDGQDMMLEAAEVSVHHIQRHLDGIESKALILGLREHIEVNVRIFVTRKTDVANLSGLTRFEKRLHGAILRENLVRVVK